MYTYMDTLGSRTLNKQISLIIYRKDYHVSWIIRWKWPMEGDIGGYPIPQYRTKNLQIPKYRVENLRNTDTAFMIGDAYLTLYPSREFFFFFFFFYLKHVYTRNQPQPSRENVRRSRIDRYNDRKARSLDVLPISS